MDIHTTLGGGFLGAALIFGGIYAGIVAGAVTACVVLNKAAPALLKKFRGRSAIAPESAS